MSTEHVIVRVRAGEPLPGSFVRLIATEDVPVGSGTNTERVYTIVVLRGVSR